MNSLALKYVEEEKNENKISFLKASMYIKSNTVFNDIKDILNKKFADANEKIEKVLRRYGYSDLVNTADNIMKNNQANYEREVKKLLDNRYKNIENVITKTDSKYEDTNDISDISGKLIENNLNDRFKTELLKNTSRQSEGAYTEINEYLINILKGEIEDGLKTKYDNICDVTMTEYSKMFAN